MKQTTISLFLVILSGTLTNLTAHSQNRRYQQPNYQQAYNQAQGYVQQYQRNLSTAWQQTQQQRPQYVPSNRNVQVGWGDVWNLTVGGVPYVVSEIGYEFYNHNRRNNGYTTYQYPVRYEVPGRAGRASNVGQLLWNLLTPAKTAYSY